MIFFKNDSQLDSRPAAVVFFGTVALFSSFFAKDAYELGRSYLLKPEVMYGYTLSEQVEVDGQIRKVKVFDVVNPGPMDLTDPRLEFRFEFEYEPKDEFWRMTALEDTTVEVPTKEGERNFKVIVRPTSKAGVLKAGNSMSVMFYYDEELRKFPETVAFHCDDWNFEPDANKPINFARSQEKIWHAINVGVFIVIVAILLGAKYQDRRDRELAKPALIDKSSGMNKAQQMKIRASADPDMTTDETEKVIELYKRSQAAKGNVPPKRK